MKVKSLFILPLILVSKMVFGLFHFFTDKYCFYFLKRNKFLLGAFIISLTASVSGCNKHQVPHRICYGAPKHSGSELLKKISLDQEKPDKV